MGRPSYKPAALTVAPFLLALLLASCGLIPEPPSDPPYTGIYSSSEVPQGSKYFFLNLNIREMVDWSAQYFRFESIGKDGTFYWDTKALSSLYVSADKKKAILGYRCGEDDITYQDPHHACYLATIDTDLSNFKAYPGITANNPSCDRGGDLIYFDDSKDIFTFTPLTGEVAKLSIPYDGAKSFPRLSPDGRKLAFIVTTEDTFSWLTFYFGSIIIYDLDTGVATNINPTSPGQITYLSWDDSGDKIVYEVDTIRVVNSYSPPMDSSLFIVALADTSKHTQLTYADDPRWGSCSYPSFLSDGNILLVSDKAKRTGITDQGSIHGDTVRELAVMAPDGTGLTVIYHPELFWPFWPLGQPCGDLAYPFYIP